MRPPQGPRGKLTRAKLRLLLGLARREKVEPRPQTIRSLVRDGLLYRTDANGLALTAKGQVAADRYVPRRRVA